MKGILVVRAGDSIHLPAVVHGVPVPSVEWIKGKNTVLDETAERQVVRRGVLMS